jgi:hypothetical protein
VFGRIGRSLAYWRRATLIARCSQSARQAPLIWRRLSHASSDAEFSTEDKAGFVAEAEDGSGSNLLGACHAPERNGLDEHLPHPLRYRSYHVRIGRSRRADIGGDAPRRELGHPAARIPNRRSRYVRSYDYSLRLPLVQ